MGFRVVERDLDKEISLGSTFLVVMEFVIFVAASDGLILAGDGSLEVELGLELAGVVDEREAGVGTEALSVTLMGDGEGDRAEIVVL